MPISSDIFRHFPFGLLDEESALKHIIVGRRNDDLIVGVGQGGYIDRVAVAVDLGVDQRLARHQRDGLDDIVVGKPLGLDDDLHCFGVEVHLWSIGRQVMLYMVPAMSMFNIDLLNTFTIGINLKAK